MARKPKGSAGVDEVAVEDFRKHAGAYLGQIARELRNGTFRFQRLRAVALPKSTPGKFRPLLIPTVKDRVVQRAILRGIGDYVAPLVDHPHSYAFQQGKGIRDAVHQLSLQIAAGKNVVLVVDVIDFFSRINSEVLFQELNTVLPDDSLKNLLSQLQRWELDDLSHLPSHKAACFPESGKGVPQGSALSPLLSNFFLRELDAGCKDRGVTAVRYADDIAVACSTIHEAREHHKWLTNQLSARGLQIHPIDHPKSRIVDVVNTSDGLDYLGVRLRLKAGTIHVTPAPASVENACAYVRQCLSSDSVDPLPERYRVLSYFLVSWLNSYSRMADVTRARAALFDQTQSSLTTLLRQRGLLPKGELTRSLREFLGIDSLFSPAGNRRADPKRAQTRPPAAASASSAS